MTSDILSGLALFASSAYSVAAAVDPSIASPTRNPANDTNFGIPHFSLVVLLAFTLLVILLLPSTRRRRIRKQQKPLQRVYRKPDLEQYAATPPAKPLQRDLD